MNKKLLICGAIATALLITACVKKEEPKQEEPEQVDTVASEAMPASEAQFQSLDAADNAPIEPTPAQTEIIREETPHTTTEIRRETPAAPVEEAPRPAAPKAEAPKAEDKPTQAAPKQHNGGAQSEDDAVAAAIAAATPALDN